MDKNCSIIEFWKRIAERVIPADSPAHKYLSHIFSHGDLASRILKRTGNNPDKQMLEDVYREISQCLASGVQLT